jgi:hypothetical protein
MALVVETGSARSDAESYISVADASAYHTARGNAAWAALASDTVREQLLRKATDYMLQAYRGRWAGVRVSSTQALDWPRYDVPMTDGPGAFDYGGVSYYASDSVPAAVARACAELALKAASGDLVADGSQAVKREKVGPLEIEYQDATTAGTNYRSVEGLLAPFMVANSGQIRLARG